MHAGTATQSDEIGPHAVGPWQQPVEPAFCAELLATVPTSTTNPRYLAVFPTSGGLVAVSDGRTTAAVPTSPALWLRLDRRIELFDGGRASGRGVLLLDCGSRAGGLADWTGAMAFLMATNPATPD